MENIRVLRQKDNGVFHRFYLQKPAEKVVENDEYAFCEGGTSYIYRATDEAGRAVLLKKFKHDTGAREHEIISLLVAKFEAVSGANYLLQDKFICESKDMNGNIEHYQVFLGWKTHTLADEILKSASLPKILTQFISFLKGMDVIHQSGFIHWDLKPENICACRLNPDAPDFILQVLDFGSVKTIEESISDFSVGKTGSASTPNWYPKKDKESLKQASIQVEQATKLTFLKKEAKNAFLQKHILTLETSAAARVLFYMLTKKQVFPTTRAQLATVLEESLNIKESRHGIYIALIEFFYKAFCEQDIKKRFFSCSHMIGELQMIINAIDFDLTTQEAKNIYYIDQLHEIQKDSFDKTKIKKISHLYAKLGDDFDVQKFNERYVLNFEKKQFNDLKKTTFRYLLFAFASIVTSIIGVIFAGCDSIHQQILMWQGVLPSYKYNPITAIGMGFTCIVMCRFLIDFIQDKGAAPRFWYIIKFQKELKLINKCISNPSPKKQNKLILAMSLINFASVLGLATFLLVNRKIRVGTILVASPPKTLFIVFLGIMVVLLSGSLLLWNKKHSKKYALDSSMGDVASIGSSILIAVVFFVVGVYFYSIFWSNSCLDHIDNIWGGLFIALAIWLIFEYCWDKFLFARNVSIALLCVCVTIGIVYGVQLETIGMDAEIVSLNNQSYLVSRDSSGETCIGTLTYDAKTVHLPHTVEGHTNTKIVAPVSFIHSQKTTSVIIENGIKTIGRESFPGNLQNITIPESISVIEDGAFFHCRNLSTVFYLGTQEQWYQLQIGAQNQALYKATIFCSDGIIYNE